ncbi:MAG: ABC transporter ATP-binding protein [Desulfovibrionales bacterium]|nr:ABC transporter ATP-binding protein [Desulfovibrionales bacterium]
MAYKIRGLSLFRGEKTILKDIHLHLSPGKIHVILGPNGAGKTSLLKCMNGIIPPSSGQIFLGTTPLESLSQDQIARRVSYMAQFTPSPQITVFEAILLGRSPRMGYRPSPGDLQKTEKLIQEFELEDLAMENLNRLSGGQRQKVGVTMAMAQESPIILMDEPTASLDLKNQHQLISLIRGKAKEKGLTLIMVLHDLNLALAQGHSFIFLKQGKIIGKESVESLRPERLEAVYEMPLEMIHHRGHPLVIPRCRRA